jgi:hypothetical protein
MVPLGGHYRYKDYFQVFPADFENLPKSTHQSHFPNVIEFWTSDEEKINISIESELLRETYSDTATMFVKLDKILSLLSVFTNNLFFRYTDTIGNWAVPLLTDNLEEETNDIATKWCLPWFHFKYLKNEIPTNSFSDLNSNEIKKVQHKHYFMLKPNIDFDSRKTIELPITIDELFDIYFSLSKENIVYLENATSYVVSAMELINTKKTLSLLGSFTAMETMVNLEFKDVASEKCEKCGQLKYSVSKKFREFLLKYIGDSAQNKKKFNSYYSLRSKIVHGGQQLKTEMLYSNIPREERLVEHLTRLEILQMGKLAIINWLLISKQSDNTK